MGGCWSGRVLAIRTCEPVRWQFGQACFPGGVGGRAEEAMAGVHEPTLVGALPSARGGRDWLMRREASMVALPFAHHSTMVLCFCGGPGFLNEHSRLQSPSLPSLQVLSSQPIAVSSPSLLSNPTFQPPAPMRTGIHTSQAGACTAVAQTICVGIILFCLPQTGCCLSSEPPTLPFCPS